MSEREEALEWLKYGDTFDREYANEILSQLREVDERVQSLSQTVKELTEAVEISAKSEAKLYERCGKYQDRIAELKATLEFIRAQFENADPDKSSLEIDYLIINRIREVLKKEKE